MHADAALKASELPKYMHATEMKKVGALVHEVSINRFINADSSQIHQCSTGGQLPCDTVIYRSPVEHWRSERVSGRSPLTENV